MNKATSSPSVIKRFLAKVQVTDYCWLWTACCTGDGYGSFWLDGRMQAAHRVSYELYAGPIPAGAEIDHTCHNTVCVNPGHLRPATRKQNKENFSRPPATNKSGVLGVSWSRRAGKWCGHVKHRGKTVYCGSFESIDDAAAAVDAKRRELFTHYQGEVCR